MQASTEKGARGLDSKVRSHLGNNLRELYEGVEDTPLSKEIAETLREMELREKTASTFRESVRMRLGTLSNSETFFLQESRVFLAIGLELAVSRKRAYTVVCEALWTFGKTRTDQGRTLIPPERTIVDWGGWPQFVGVPSDDTADVFWHRLTMALHPKSEAEWRDFLEIGSAFIFALMLRHERSNEFWLYLSTFADGALQTAARARLLELS